MGLGAPVAADAAGMVAGEQQDEATEELKDEEPGEVSLPMASSSGKVEGMSFNVPRSQNVPVEKSARDKEVRVMGVRFAILLSGCCLLRISVGVALQFFELMRKQKEDEELQKKRALESMTPEERQATLAKEAEGQKHDESHMDHLKRLNKTLVANKASVLGSPGRGGGRGRGRGMG